MTRFLFIASLVLMLSSANELRAQFGPANVIVAEVIERPVAPTQNFVATISPLRKSIVGSAVAGRVEKFLYDEASPETKLTRVQKGQVLANLREGTIRIQVEVATAQRDLRMAEWEEAEQTQEGKEELAEALLTAASENYQFNRKQYERNEKLYKSGGSIALEEVERSRNEYATARQAYIAAGINNENVKRGDNIRQAKARLDEANAVLRELQDRLEKYTIYAPFNGFVVTEHTEVGAWIRSGDPVAEVVQLHPVEVRAFVPEKYIGNVQIDAKAKVVPSAGGKSATGTITGIVAEAVSRSRTFPVKIQIENPDHVFKAGMLAEVTLAVGEKQPLNLVPKDALVLGGQSPRIFLAVPDPDDDQKYVAKMMPVREGPSLGDWIAVTPIADEIIPGDLVIEKGNERLRPNAPLIVNRDGASQPPPEE